MGWKQRAKSSSTNALAVREAFASFERGRARAARPWAALVDTAMAVLQAKLHTQGGPRRRPALAQARQGRRIIGIKLFGQVNPEHNG